MTPSNTHEAQKIGRIRTSAPNIRQCKSQRVGRGSDRSMIDSKPALLSLLVEVGALDQRLPVILQHRLDGLAFAQLALVADDDLFLARQIADDLAVVVKQLDLDQLAVIDLLIDPLQ